MCFALSIVADAIFIGPTYVTVDIAVVHDDNVVTAVSVDSVWLLIL